MSRKRLITNFKVKIAIRIQILKKKKKKRCSFWTAKNFWICPTLNHPTYQALVIQIAFDAGKTVTCSSYLPLIRPPLGAYHGKKASDASKTVTCFSYLPLIRPPPHQEPAACRPCGTVSPDASVLGLAASTGGKWAEGAALECSRTDAYTVHARKGAHSSFPGLMLCQLSKQAKQHKKTCLPSVRCCLFWRKSLCELMQYF